MRDPMSLHGWVRMCLHHTYKGYDAGSAAPACSSSCGGAVSKSAAVRFLRLFGERGPRIAGLRFRCLPGGPMTCQHRLACSSLRCYSELVICITSTCGEWTFIVLSQWLCRVWHAYCKWWWNASTLPASSSDLSAGLGVKVSSRYSRAFRDNSIHRSLLARVVQGLGTEKHTL